MHRPLELTFLESSSVDRKKRILYRRSGTVAGGAKGAYVPNLLGEEGTKFTLNFASVHGF